MNDIECSVERFLQKQGIWYVKQIIKNWTIISIIRYPKNDAVFKAWILKAKQKDIAPDVLLSYGGDDWSIEKIKDWKESGVFLYTGFLNINED